jgi:5'-nucleotidase
VVTAAYGEPLLMDGAIPEDPAVAARVAELAKPLGALNAEVVGAVAGDVEADPQTCRSGLCPMGVLVAEAVLDATRAQGVEIALFNGGGLRAPLAAGDVTRGDVLTALPFGNTVSTFRLTGADVVAALETGVSEVETLGGRFPQGAGLRYAWSSSRPAGEGRVRAVQVHRNGEWVNIDLEATYGVAANSFLRAGGDGYAVFAEKAEDAYDFGPTVAETVVRYLQGGPYVPALDDRIIRMR